MADDYISSLETFVVSKAPPTAFYISNFITEEDEEKIISSIYAAPKPKWTQLAHRRLQNWGGLPHPKGMVAEPIPSWLQKEVDMVSSLGVFGQSRPNHVLINEYLPGQGIMPHEDGPLFYPVVATVSVGSHTVLELYSRVSEDVDDDDIENKQGQDFSARCLGALLLERRSLLVLKDDMYTSVLHGISERYTDEVNENYLNLRLCSIDSDKAKTLKRLTRLSLTIRSVPKVLKTRMLFGKR